MKLSFLAPNIKFVGVLVLALIVTPCHAAWLESVLTNATNEDWTTVNLNKTYVDPVVVCTVRYPENGDVTNSTPTIVRIQNAASTSFELLLQNPVLDPGNVSNTTLPVDCLVVEEGLWTMDDGTQIEAQKYTSDDTAYLDNWDPPQAQVQTYLGDSYSSPVVLGQVMSYNDPGWSAFFSRASSDRSEPPNSASLLTGKHVGQDPDTARDDETIGFIVIESGHGTASGIEYEARLGEDIVRGIGVQASYAYSYNQAFGAEPAVTIVTQMAMDGTQGSYAVLSGAQTASEAGVVLDEDTTFATDRIHTTEQVGYLSLLSQGQIDLTQVVGDTPSPTQQPTSTPCGSRGEECCDIESDQRLLLDLSPELNSDGCEYQLICDCGKCCDCGGLGERCCNEPSFDLDDNSELDSVCMKDLECTREGLCVEPVCRRDDSSSLPDPGCRDTAPVCYDKSTSSRPGNDEAGDSCVPCVNTGDVPALGCLDDGLPICLADPGQSGTKCVACINTAVQGIPDEGCSCDARPNCFDSIAGEEPDSYAVGTVCLDPALLPCPGESIVLDDGDDGGAGRWSSLQLDSNGCAVATYYSFTSTSNDLKLARYNDTSCSASGLDIQTLVSKPQTIFLEISLQLDDNGCAVVTYVDFSLVTDDRLLQVAKYNDTSCNVLDIQDIETDVALPTSLKLDRNGCPVVSYYSLQQKLKLARYIGASCNVLDIQTVDNVTVFAGGNGNPSLQLDHSGCPVMSYYDETNRNLKLARYAGANCDVLDTQVLDDGGGIAVGEYNSLQLDFNDCPVVSYFDRSNFDLKLFRYTDAACSVQDIQVIDSQGGAFTSLQLDRNGCPVVSYYLGSSLKLASYTDADCTVMDIQVLDDSDSGLFSQYSSLQLDQDGCPVVLYFESFGVLEGQLKLYRPTPCATD